MLSKLTQRTSADAKLTFHFFSFQLSGKDCVKAPESQSRSRSVSNQSKAQEEEVVRAARSVFTKQEALFCSQKLGHSRPLLIY